LGPRQNLLKVNAPSTDGVAAAPAEAKVVPAGEFAALTLGGRADVSAKAKAEPVEGP